MRISALTLARVRRRSRVVLWEMYGENNRGAINDWIMTTMGGVTIGETFHRSAKLLRNNEQRGVSRSLREFGAFFIDPVGSMNRAMRGEATRVGEFDSFRLSVQANFSDKVPIGRLGVRRTLWGTQLKDDPRTRHSLTFDQQFLYLENRAAETGGHWAVRTEVRPLFTLLSGINSEYGELTGRPYDFGMGAGLGFSGQLAYKGYPVLRLAYTDLFSATINGAKGRHNLGIPVVQARWKIARSVGLGVDYWTLIRHSFYDDFTQPDGAVVELPDIRRVSPTFRLNVTFTWVKHAQSLR